MFRILESVGARLVDRFVPAIDAAAMPIAPPPGHPLCEPRSYGPDQCPIPGCQPGYGCNVQPDCNVICTSW